VLRERGCLPAAWLVKGGLAPPLFLNVYLLDLSLSLPLRFPLSSLGSRAPSPTNRYVPFFLVRSTCPLIHSLSLSLSLPLFAFASFPRRYLCVYRATYAVRLRRKFSRARVPATPPLARDLRGQLHAFLDLQGECVSLVR